MLQPQSDQPVPMSEDAIVFRVLRGLQSGAVAALGSGRHVIGAGDEADLVLLGRGMVDGHLAVTLGGAELLVEALDGEVVLADRKLSPGEQAELPPGVAIEIGDTVIGIGPEDTNWSALPEPGSAIVAEPEPQPSPEAEEQQGAEEAPPETAPETSAAVDVQESSDTETEDPADVPPAAPREPSIGLRAGAVVALVAALLIGGFDKLRELAAQSGVESPAIGDALTAPDPRPARDVIAALGLPEVRVAVRGGRLTLQGFVPNAQSMERLEAALAKAEIDADNRVANVATLLTTARERVESYPWPEPDFGPHLKLRYSGSGVLTIDGFLGSEIDRAALRRTLLVPEPALTGIELTRDSLVDWRRILQRSIEAAGLGIWLKVDEVDGLLRVSGRVTAREGETWRSVGQDFVERSGGWPRLLIRVEATEGTIVNTDDEPAPQPKPVAEVSEPAEPAPENVTSPSEPVRRPDLKIIGVITSTDGASRVLLNDGSNHVAGDEIADGVYVKDVQYDRVIVTRDDRDFAYRIEGTQ